MTFDELVTIVAEYAAEFGITPAESIHDLEFDGPNGSTGPSLNDLERLTRHFIGLGLLHTQY